MNLFIKQRSEKIILFYILQFIKFATSITIYFKGENFCDIIYITNFYLKNEGDRNTLAIFTISAFDFLNN